MIKLLLVEDDEDLCYIIKSSFQYMLGGYEVVTATNGEEGLEMYRRQHPDIIVADVDMPLMNGFEMVARIRELDGNVPILFASAQVSAKDVIDGYRFGANNYIKKPFIPEEMDAHIKALLKTAEGKRMRNETLLFTIGQYQFDAERLTLIDRNGDKKRLTMLECQILHLLVKNKGEIVKRSMIEEKCWGKGKVDDYFTSRSLDVFIAKLRNYLNADPSVEIKTLRSIGLILTDNSSA